jgi:mono/diheme cytochrome c family protein
MPSLSTYILAVIALPFAVRGAGQEINFEKDVRPILKAHCTHCHGEEEKPKGGVDLRLRRFMDKELDGGLHVLVPGNPDKSEMILLVREGEMPKKGKRLPDDQIAILERWVAQGAKTTRPEPETLPPGAYIAEDDREFWSFKPIARPAVPEVQSPRFAARNPIDAFIFTKLREQQLGFAPEADRQTLIRRVTLDLTGLPPTPAEVDAFVNDHSPDAYEKVVDRLLASPTYGERWARHWLDVAGYADSNGFSEADSLRPHAWRYRDYVIRSLNADKPWNEFITEQLAGDELAGATHADTQVAVLDPERRDELIATGFLRMAPDGTGDPNDDMKLARNQVIAEELKIVSSSLLGLTVGCAQCHDHRYDPIPQTDYYRLRAIFEPAFDWQAAWRTPSQRLYSLYTPDERAKAAEVEKQVAGINREAQAMSRKFLDEIFEKKILELPEAEREPYREARATAEKDRTPAQKALIKKYPNALALYSLDLYDKGAQKKVTDKIAEGTRLRATLPPEGMVMALTEVKGAVPKTFLFNRGDHDQPKQEVQPGELTVLATPQVEPFRAEKVESGSSGRRLAYARWLTSGKHPLVARVLVNRFWLNHFGRGIVNTPGDFGAQGERPTHPELLDWLASEFMDGGWKLKPLHKLMVTSATYRQSSRNDASLRVDPDNGLFGRFKLRRLDAEALRDTMLAAAGQLNPSPFGPPSTIARDPLGRIVVGKEKLNRNRDVTNVEPAGPGDFRRSIYIQVRRKTPLTVLDTFDAPSMLPNCELRTHTTVAPQSLMMMNDAFVVDTSHSLAARLAGDLPGDTRTQIVSAWRILFNCPPSEKDITAGVAYVTAQAVAIRANEAKLPKAKNGPPFDPALDALASYCQVLFSSNRFLYIE